jgi:hypothetical protein
MIYRNWAVHKSSGISVAAKGSFLVPAVAAFPQSEITKEALREPVGKADFGGEDRDIQEGVVAEIFLALRCPVPRPLLRVRLPGYDGGHRITSIARSLHSRLRALRRFQCSRHLSSQKFLRARVPEGLVASGDNHRSGCLAWRPPFKEHRA